MSKKTVPPKEEVQSSTSEKRRLGGGPVVDARVAEWWENMMKHVKKEDGMADCSMPDLLTRIYKADLDLTYASIEVYKQCNRHPPRNGRGAA